MARFKQAGEWWGRLPACGWGLACVLTWLWLLPIAAVAAEVEWSCGPPSLGAPCPQTGPATLALGDGTPRGLGNPVHLGSGRKYQREIDWHAHDGELGLEVVRHYQSADPRDTGLGRGWRLSYDTRVYPVGKGWQVVQADGSRLWFLPGAGGTDICLAVGVDAGQFRRLPDGGYHWTWPNGRQLRFDTHGLLVEIQGRGSGSLRLWRGQVPGRADFGRLLRARDPQGREMHLHYEGSRLVAIRLPEGALRYWHAEESRLRGVGYPSGRVRLYGYQPEYQGGAPGASAHLTATWWWDPQAGLQPRWAWTYDDTGRVVEVRPGGRHGPATTLRYGADAPGVAGVLDAPAFHGAASQVVVESGGVARVWQPPSAGNRIRTGVDADGGTRFAAGRDTGVQGAGRPVDLQLPGALNAWPKRLHFDWGSSPATTGPVDLPGRIVESGWREPVAPGGPAVAVTREWRWSAPPSAAKSDGNEKGWRLLRFGDAAAWPDPQQAEAGWPGLRLWQDDLGTVWRWESAVTGRFERAATASDPSQQQWRFANGSLWRFSYDEQGLLTRWQRQDPEGNEDEVAVERAPGVVSIVHRHERETWGQLTGGGAARRIERPAMGSAPAWHYEEVLWRDASGRIAVHELPEGGRLEYFHDSSGRLSGIQWQPAAGPARWLYQRDAAGLRLANGSRVGADFQGGRLALLWQALPDGRLALAHRRAYDPQGRPVAESLRVAGRPPRHRVLAYDSQDRLAVVVQDGVEQRVAWMPAGDARARWAPEVAAATEAPLRRASPRPSSGPGRITSTSPGHATFPPPVSRDASGLPSRVGDWQLRQGPGRRLAAVALADGRHLRYFHNARGEQVARDDETTTTQALYLGHQRVGEAGWRRGGWRVTHRLVLAGELPVAWIEYHPSRAGPAATVFTLHADAMGIPLAATDDVGRLRWSTEVDVWGRLQTETGGVGLALRLPGQWADALTGWHDNYLRTYDPAWGHYLEPDPAGPPGSQAAGVGSATAFGYAGHQPRRWLDPTGLVLFAFDGTLQDASSGANVHRLSLWYRDHSAVAAGLASAYYEAGPGGWPILDLDAAMAWSAERIVQTQWDHLLRHLAAFETAADPVALDLLGYSRGAALARHFANRIVGKVRQGRFWDWDDELGAVTACVDTRFMGLFDTVAQFGFLGARDAVFDLAIAPAWRGVAHAVALHERRALFPLVSINSPGGELPSGWEELPFVGAHGDIGGGLVVPGGLAPGEMALSDVSLNWMAEQAAALGAVLDRSTPPAAGEWAWLHDFRTPYQRLAGLQHDQTHGPLLGVAVSDRALRAASGIPWLDAQGAHDLLGLAQRSTAELWIERTERWLGHPDPAVARVDLEAYQRWLSELS